MAIEYKDIKNFSPKVLQDLFFSVDWESGQYPEKLAAAMQHSDAVYSAWDGDPAYGPAILFFFDGQGKVERFELINMVD